MVGGLIEVNIKFRAPRDYEDLASGARRGDHDGGMAEVLETAGDAR